MIHRKSQFAILGEKYLQKFILGTPETGGTRFLARCHFKLSSVLDFWQVRLIVVISILLFTFGHASEAGALTRGEPFSPLISDSSTELLYSSRIKYLPTQAEVWVEHEGPLLWQAEDYDLYQGALIEYLLPGRTQLGDEPAFYLWRYSMNARILLNGVVISEIGEFYPPSRNLHLPQLAKLPISLLREDENKVHVELVVVPGYGYLLPPALGQYDALKVQYDLRYFNQITLHKIIFGLTVFLMLLGLLLWLFDTSTSSYFYFSLGAFSWAIYSLNPFIQSIPFSSSAWLWLLHTFVDVFSVSMVMFIHRHYAIRRSKVEKCAWGYVIINTMGYAILPGDNFSQYSAYLHLGSFVLVIYGFWTCLTLGYRHERRDAYAFAICFLGFLTLGIHDVLLATAVVEELWINSFFMLGLGAPLFLLCAGAQLMWQLKRANVHMEWSLNKAKARLDESFAVRTQLEKDSAAAEERARIYRDLHDDLGAKLLDMIYLAENGKQASLAREALGEMRSIVSSPQYRPLYLSDWSTITALDVTERLDEAKITLHWHTHGVSDELGKGPLLSGIQQYHLTRIVRELVSNAIKHAQATVVSIDLTLDDMLGMNYEDNGVGTTSSALMGTGMAGIRRRVQELGGHSSSENKSQELQPAVGFKFWLKVPLAG